MTSVNNTSDSVMWAFVDEYGNPNLATEKDGVSQYFIVAIVLVCDSELSSLRAALEEIRHRYFQKGEMKAKRLGRDRHRWEKLLTELASLNFHFHAYVANKTEVDRASGLQYKQSFYKNMFHRAYDIIVRAYPTLNVRADSYGRSSFMESFKKYIAKRQGLSNQLTLFGDRKTFEFSDSRTEPLIQLADIIAGLLARAYEPGKQLENPEELIGILSGKMLSITEWPVKYRWAKPVTKPADKKDARIAQRAVSLAEKFIDEHRMSPGEEEQARVAVLEHLLVEQRFGAGRAISTDELVDTLAARGITDKDKTWIRRQVIAPLRDQGLLITSSISGYKLPEGRADMLDFASHAYSVCIPMLNRLKAACDLTRSITLGDVEVLAEPEMAAVKRLIDALGHATASTPIEP